MKRALAIFSLTFLALGCATMDQETRMHRGPFGRTEIGGYVVASDPSSSRVLLQTYDGELWVYDVTDRAAGRLGTLMVGDEINLAFDDRVAGPRVVAIEMIPPGRNRLPGGLVSVAQFLPYGVTFGAPAVAPSATAMASGSVSNTGIPLVGTGIVGGAVVGPGFVGPGFVGTPGVIVPGFGSFATLTPGLVTPQAAATLGIVPGAGIIRTSGGVATASGSNAAGAPVTSGNFSPGTVAPGVTTANPAAPGRPVIQGPFTPGTVAPGASASQGTAPPQSTPGRTTPMGTGPNAAPRVRDGGTTAQPARPGTTTTPQGTTTTPRQNQ